MIHNIGKTTELPTNKCRTYWIEDKDEAEKLAGEHEAYLLPVNKGFYLFVVEGQ